MSSDMCIRQHMFADAFNRNVNDEQMSIAHVTSDCTDTSAQPAILCDTYRPVILRDTYRPVILRDTYRPVILRDTHSLVVLHV